VSPACQLGFEISGCDILPGDILPGDILPGDILPGDILLDDIVLDDIVPGGVIPRHSVATDTAPGDPVDAIEARLQLAQGTVEQAPGARHHRSPPRR
jgi:hypothetical protein